MDGPPSGFTVSCWPQNGHTGPSGHRVASSNLRASSSSVKAGLVKSHMAVPYGRYHAIGLLISQVYSCRAPGQNSHRIVLTNTRIKTSREISDDVDLPLSQLNGYKIVLTKKESVSFLQSQGVMITLKQYKNLSTKAVHEARFGPNRLGTGEGHVFSYAELCMLAGAALALEI